MSAYDSSHSYLMPVGALIKMASELEVAPYGFLKCDGSSLSKESYPELYSVIKDEYGSLDSEHFNIPDLRKELWLIKYC